MAAERPMSEAMPFSFAPTEFAGKRAVVSGSSARTDCRRPHSVNEQFWKDRFGSAQFNAGRPMIGLARKYGSTG
jgi:hypothetical protein